MRARFTDDEWLREEALLLLDGDSEVRDLFLELTDHGELGLRTDPRAKSLKWDTWNPPAHAEISRDAALRLLIDDGYVVGIERRGRSDYLVRASDKAKAVRSIYDHLPERSPGSASETRPVTE